MKSAQFDAQFIAAFNQGDTTVFTKVFRALYPAIFHFANKLLKDSDQAEDIASETFVKVWNKRAELVSFDNIKAFAYIVARNAAFNHLQSVTRKGESHKEIFYLSKDADEQLLDFEMINADVIAELHNEIEFLPPQCGIVFKKMYFERKSSDEVAKEMGITRKTVLNQKLKAISLLRAGLFKKGLITIALNIVAAISYLARDLR